MNVRKNRRNNQEWFIQRHGQHSTQDTERNTNKLKIKKHKTEN
jgi:hypothetical protein